MPTKRQRKPAPPDIPPEHQALYERYLAPFLQIADTINPKAKQPPEFQILGAFASVTPYIAYIDIIVDVVLDAYLNQLKRLSVGDIVKIIGILDECAMMKAQNELFILNEQIAFAVPHEQFLICDLVEEITEQLRNDSPFKERPFILYYALAIMQLSLILSEKDEDAPDEQRIARFIDMRVCLERAQFVLGVFSQKDTSHKAVASKGGRKRFSVYYGAAKEYALRRYQEMKATDPSLSKRQAALDIAEEAAEHPAFKRMSEGNLYETIYNGWLRKM